MADGSVAKGESLRRRMERRLARMRTDRFTFEPEWMDLRDNFYPSSGRFTIQQPAQSRTQRSGRRIIDDTPVASGKTLSSGMMSGLTSPARPWYRLTTPDQSVAELASVKDWLSRVQQRMNEVFAKSNLYNVLPQTYRELGIYGTGCALALEDEKEIMRFVPLTIGRYWLATDMHGRVDTLYREQAMTIRQVVQEFGIDACSSRVRNMWENGQLESECTVIHAIEPNDDADPSLKTYRGMAWRSVYWEKDGATNDKFLRQSGFRENPILAPRWDIVGEDVYGTGPGLDALGNAKQLQHQQRQKLKAVDKQVDPPLQAPTSLRNDVVSGLPGQITFFDQQQGQAGVRSIYDVRFDTSGVLEDIGEIRQAIRAAFYADMFLMLANDERTQPPTAEEIIERRSEKMLMLGPVLERLNDELLDPLIDRTFNVLFRRSVPMWLAGGEGLIPRPPDEMMNSPNNQLRVEYISVLAQAQKNVGVTATTQFVQFVGGLAAAKQDPSVFDKLDSDQTIDEMAEMLGVAPRIVVPDDDVAALRQKRQQMQMAQQAAAMAKPAADGAQAVKSLSDANTQDPSVLNNIIQSAQAQQAPA